MIDGLENIENFGETDFFDSPSPGVKVLSGEYSLHSALKVYFSQSNNLEGSSVGLAFRQRTYNFDSWNKNVTSSDVYILSSA